MNKTEEFDIRHNVYAILLCILFGFRAEESLTIFGLINNNEEGN